MTTKTPISEIRCLAVDLVLLGCFEWRELANLLQQAGLPVPSCCADGLPRAVLRQAHCATHRVCAFTRLIEHQLDFLNAQAMRKIGSSEACDLAKQFHREGIPAEDLPSVVWALAREPRTEFRPFLDDILHQAQFLALDNLLRSGPEAQAE